MFKFVANIIKKLVVGNNEDVINAKNGDMFLYGKLTITKDVDTIKISITSDHDGVLLASSISYDVMDGDTITLTDVLIASKIEVQ